ncbi:MAG: metal-dependent transcriptional regulator [Candidatus Latescibacterota bacterium]|nr:MAG: metal-dependent transcriptional regulator [Candidatus Latescibacterota bacterium]
MQHDKDSSHELLDEVLSILYAKWERGGTITPEQLVRVKHGGHVFTRDVVENAVDTGHVTYKNGHIELTETGFRRAKTILRCNRLAERLLVDVLRVRDELVEPSACRLEHILSEEVAESICTLLGHPRTCPHGNPIPPGACCRQAMTEVQPIVRPLSSLRPGEEGTIAYISSRYHARLKRLASLGVMPGQNVVVKQVRPSFVVAYGETELAIEKGVADEIYLRIPNNMHKP